MYMFQRLSFPCTSQSCFLIRFSMALTSNVLVGYNCFRLTAQFTVCTQYPWYPILPAVWYHTSLWSTFSLHYKPHFTLRLPVHFSPFPTPSAALHHPSFPSRVPARTICILLRPSRFLGIPHKNVVRHTHASTNQSLSREGTFRRSLVHLSLSHNLQLRLVYFLDLLMSFALLSLPFALYHDIGLATVRNW